MSPRGCWFHLFSRSFLFAACVLLIVVGCSKSSNPVSPDAGLNSITQDELETVQVSGADVSRRTPIGGYGLTQGREYFDNEVLVVLQDSMGGSVSPSLLDNLPLRALKVIKCRWATVFELEITDGTPVPTMVQRLKGDSRVKIAEPNYILPFMEAPYWPNDPMWESDDAGDDPRDSVYDHWGPAKLAADVVWNESKGSEDVVVAIIDTGVRFDHEDLNDNIWINEDEIPDNGTDDDLNGWVDDWWGWDCWDEDNDPWDDGAYASYHGTACSGVAAAVQDNERGLCGVAPGIRIMALKTDLTGSGGLVSTVVEAFEYARINGADICSMSFGTGSYSEILENACNDTWDNGNGPILMASAGNYSSTSPLYPASFDSVQAIGATVPFRSNNQPCDEARVSSALGYGWGSNYGEQLTVMGFGDKYMTTYGGHYDGYWDGYYEGFFGGTSCACPMSAGVMALIKSYFPGESQQWCIDRIEDTADDLDAPGFDIETGYGRCNALRAVYGSDRYEDQEDPLGFVPLTLPEAQVFDSLHDIPGNPYYDTIDLYRFTATADGFLMIDLDIYTWGENLDMTLFGDEQLSQLLDSSTGPNHYDSSSESIFIGAEEGKEYFLKVFSPEQGNSTTYGLKVYNASNELTVHGKSLAPPYVHQHGSKVPILKLTFDIGYQATLQELILYKSGTLPLSSWSKVSLYADTISNGELDPGDAILEAKTGMGLNRVIFDSLGLEWDWQKPLTLFVTCDFSQTAEDRTFQLSLESYKDVVTGEGFDATYMCFPIASDVLTIGTDLNPPEWDTTQGAQTAESVYTCANIGWNNATDWQSPPVHYNVYYSDTLPFDIGTAVVVEDVPFEEGTTTDWSYMVCGLPKEGLMHFVVRAVDDVGNEDENLEVVSCEMGGGGDPSHPVVLMTFPETYPFCVALDEELLVVGTSGHGLRIYNRTNPVMLQYITYWSSDTIYDVLLHQHFAFCTLSSYVYSIDLNSPISPVTADYLSYPSGVCEVRSGDWLYVASSSSKSLKPIKIADPANLDGYPEIDLSWGGTPLSIAVYGEYLYVTCSGKGVVVLNIHYPGFPTPLNVFGATSARGLLVSGDVLYVSDNSSGALTAYDLTSDPAAPDELGSCSGGPGVPGDSLVKLGDFVYMERMDYGIVVFDVTDPENMSQVGDLAVNSIRDLATDGDFIYALAYYDGIKVII